MRFLLDQSADFRLIPHLQALGHDVTAISRNYPHGLADEDVLTIARDEQRILIVADRDFGESIFQQGLAHAGVLFFRLPGAPLSTKIEQLNRALTRIFMDHFCQAHRPQTKGGTSAISLQTNVFPPGIAQV